MNAASRKVESRIAKTRAIRFRVSAFRANREAIERRNRVPVESRIVSSLRHEQVRLAMTTHYVKRNYAANGKKKPRSAAVRAATSQLGELCSGMAVVRRLDARK